MSQIDLSISEGLLADNKSIHLPKDKRTKEQLLKRIDHCIQSLKDNDGNNQHIQLLMLRKKLIDKYGLSVERIDNLECIFLHYCSHIFKTGKHMTFERLQYEKSHLTMDRFFSFLKDFTLTTAVMDESQRQILDKTELILIFKRMSINCKDLNFQQFISCLEKIGILYYDSKINFKAKQEKLAIDRKKRKENYVKSLKRRKAALEAAKNKITGNQAEQNEDKLTDHEENNEEIGIPNNNEGDKIQSNELEENLINDKNVEENLLKDKNLDNLQQQIKLENDVNQNQPNQPQQPIQQSNIDLQITKSNPIHEDTVFVKPKVKVQDVLVLTPQQKIQYFFQLINVDNSVSFKKKMRQLNLPIFQTKHRRAVSHPDIPNISSKEIKIPEITLQQQKRLDQLRTIFEERKERDKSNSPHMNKDDYEYRRRKRKIEEEQVIIKRLPKQKKIEVSQLQTDLSSLSKMEFDKINFRKFQPHKLYQASEQDDIYLEEYGSTRKPQLSQKRIPSSLQISEKNSQMLLDRLKKRAQEIQSRERMEQSKYSVAQEVNISTEHQLRKNRLVQKLLKLQRG